MTPPDLLTTHPTDSSRPWRGLLATARQLGRYAWTERRLFEVLGTFSVVEESPATKVMFDAQSHEHAWHAEVLVARLPELREVDAESLIEAPGPAFEALVAEVGRSTTPVERAVGVYEVLVPHLITAYRHELSGTTDVAGASLLRWLPLLVADLVEQCAAGRDLLTTLLVDAPSRELADRTRDGFVGSLDRSGGLLDRP